MKKIPINGESVFTGICILFKMKLKTQKKKIQKNQNDRHFGLAHQSVYMRKPINYYIKET